MVFIGMHDRGHLGSLPFPVLVQVGEVKYASEY